MKATGYPPYRDIDERNNKKQPKQLPIEKIDGKQYYRDDRLREYRRVDNPHERISFAGLPDGVTSALTKIRDFYDEKGRGS
jgi:hypothetical protein